MKIFFRIFMTLSIVANIAGFIVALDGQLDFLSWRALEGWTMIGNGALILTTVIPFLYAGWLLLKKLKERRMKRYLAAKVMYLL